MLTLAERCRGKRVLFIPIYSMRDYQTGEYNLDNDGNFARILSALANINFVEATVLIPSKRRSLTRIDKPVFQHNVSFIECNAYGKNAKETRDTYDFFDWMIDCNIDFVDYDCIVVEPNTFTEQLCGSSLEKKLVYWCVASKTSQGTPWFVEDYVERDKRIAQFIPVACANQAQVEYLGGKAYVEPIFYDAKTFDYKTIFFPFRLSDENYKADAFKAAVLKLAQDEDLPNFKVLYTDPNSSEIFKNLPCSKQISSDHDVYLQVLKGRPIIPYLENDNVLEHISINEFIYYHCELIMISQRHKRAYDNIIYINDTDCLYEALRNLLLK